MFKKEKGITLVALVVTIIVLLILAGVTISLTLSNNGIFQKAKTAGNTYTAAKTNEATDMNTYAAEMQNTMNQYGL